MKTRIELDKFDKYKKTYKIEGIDLKWLIVGEVMFEALNNGGVHSWEGYKDSIQEYCNQVYNLLKSHPKLSYHLDEKTQDEFNINTWVDILFADYEVCEN